MEEMDLILKNGTIVTAETSFCGTIGIKDEKIAFITTSDTIDFPAKHTLDLSGLHILPGVIDPHIHFQDPGYTEREDFEHATLAAASGGITTVLSQPLDNPPTTSISAYHIKEDAYRNHSYLDYGIHAGATADNIDELEAIWNTTGATAIKMFMCFSVVEFPFVDDEAMLKILKILAKNQALALIHCENNAILNIREAELKAEGRKDPMAYNLSHPKEAEIEAIRRAIYFLEITGAEAVILHVSTAEGLKLIHEAKERGVKVWSESAPHFYHFIDTDIQQIGPFLKCSPVMHDADNRDEMWKLFSMGYLDTIGSDHSPYTYDEKACAINDIWKAPNGITGLETSLAVFLDGVNRGKITLNQLVRASSYNTAQIYGLYPQKGIICPGSDADFAIVDMNLEKTFTKENIFCKCGWSPYVGETLKGWPVMTILRGTIIFCDNKVQVPLGYGKYIERKKEKEDSL